MALRNLNKPAEFTATVEAGLKVKPGDTNLEKLLYGYCMKQAQAAQKAGKGLCIGALPQLHECLQYPAQRLCQTEQQPHRSTQRKQQCKRRGVPLQ